MGGSTSKTGSVLFSLLDRPNDRNAWERFVDLYGPKILDWCKRRGVQPADAEDITQQVLFKFIELAPTFNYDESGSFRGWLRTLTRNAVIDLFRKRGRLRWTGSSEQLEQLQDPVALEDLQNSLDQVSEQELLKHAMDTVQMQVEANTWKAFHMMAFEGLSGKQVANELGMKASNVYVARGRVQKKLQEQIKKLGGEP